MAETALTTMIDTLKIADPERNGLSVDAVYELLPDWQLVGVMGMLDQAQHAGLVVKDGDVFKWV